MSATKELSELITQSVIDSRDIIERLNELEAFDSDDHEPPTITNEEKEELSVLKAFAEEVEGYCVDFIHAESLIAEGSRLLRTPKRYGIGSVAVQQSKNGLGRCGRRFEG